MEVRRPAPRGRAHLSSGVSCTLLEKWRRIVSDELKIPDVPESAADVVDAWFVDYDFKPFQDRLTEELAKANSQ